VINLSYQTFLTLIIALIYTHQNWAYDGENSDKLAGRAKADIIQRSWDNYKGNRLNIDESGEAYLKFGILAQAWYAHSWNNPGTIGIDGEIANTSNVMGFRRSRFTIYGNYFNKLHFYAQVGVNNQILSTGGRVPPKMYLHDFWMAYTVKKDLMNIGVGLNYFNGISRLSSRSSVSMLLLDYQNFIYPNLGHTDQTGRQLGVFAYGNMKGLDYRISLAQPFVYDNSHDDPNRINKSFEIANNNFSIKGYFSYNFLDKESSATPFYSMNYLGKKRIFNIGAGFDTHPPSIAHFNADGELIKTDRKHFAIDVFAELPQKNGGVFSFYSVGYRLDFGPNYLRSAGLMQPTLSVDPHNEPIPQGPGVSQYYVGTGNIWYTNIGYLISRHLTGSKIGIQPFAAVNFKDLEGLSQSSWQYDIGLNYLIFGNHFKISTQYSSRPVYTGATGFNDQTKLLGHKGMLIFQFQVAL